MIRKYINSVIEDIYNCFTNMNKIFINIKVSGLDL